VIIVSQANLDRQMTRAIRRLDLRLTQRVHTRSLRRGSSFRTLRVLSAQAPQLAATMRRYLIQLTTFLAPRSVDVADSTLRQLRTARGHGAKAIGIVIVAEGVSKPASLTST
jgi:hypothetical protein